MIIRQRDVNWLHASQQLFKISSSAMDDLKPGGGGWEEGDFKGRGLKLEENLGHEHTGGVWVVGMEDGGGAGK